MSSGGSGWLAGLAFLVDDESRWPSVGSAAASGAGGSFTLDRDEAQDLLNKTDVVLVQLDRLRHEAATLKDMSPPAGDPVSSGFNHVAVGDGRELGVFNWGMGHVDREHAYLTELRNRLADCLGQTVDTDEHSGAEMKKVHDDGGGAWG